MPQFNPEPADENRSGSGQNSQSRRRVAESIDRLQDSTPYWRVARYENTRSFPKCHLTGTVWAKGKPEGPKILYPFPELLAATRAPVLTVEGETGFGGASDDTEDVLVYALHELHALFATDADVTADDACLAALNRFTDDDEEPRQ
jgi:hypothetical protein